tara:strand:- start:899 stop:1216 length:318 start_codon:yes stop_codon:yes gene_type:complete
MVKNYHSREELEIDVQFINDMIKDEEYSTILINILFENWRKTSPDSPWYEEESDVLECANTLIKISEGSGIGSEWCGEHIVFETVCSKGTKKPLPGNNRYNLRPR